MNLIQKNLIAILVGVLFTLISQQNASAYYDPGVQRWINRDPISEDGGINLYAFIENDPLTTLDKFGLASGDLIGPMQQDPVFDPGQWGKENCLAYAANRPCGKEMYPGIGPNDSYDNCGDLKKALKKNYGAVEPTGGKCPPGYHKIRVYPGFHVQRQDADGKWSEKNYRHHARRCATDGSGEPIDSPEDLGMKPQKTCKGDLCLEN